MSFWTRAAAPVLFVLMAAGCGRNYVVGSEDDATGGAGAASGSGTDGGAIVGVSNPSPETVSTACAAPLGDRLWTNSIPELRRAMLGRWFRCPVTPRPDGDGGAFPVFAFGGQSGDPLEAGLELTDDGRFRTFDWGDGNTLVQRPGLLNGGEVVFFVTGSDESGHPRIQVNFAYDSGSTGLTVPVLSDVPRVLLLAEMYHFIAETR
jgi:hypothetical protein